MGCAETRDRFESCEDLGFRIKRLVSSVDNEIGCGIKFLGLRVESSGCRV